MTSLAATLDGTALIWCPDGSDRTVPVAELPTGNGSNSLAPGEVLRAVELPVAALRSRTSLRRIALAELGRSGAVLTGRVDDDGSCLFTITAATLRPVLLRYPQVPAPGVLRAAAEAASGYYTDALGSADWRRQVNGLLLEEVRNDVAGPADG